MRDLDRALTDISAIREQIARGTEFRGYGPAGLTATGLLALLIAAGQALWFRSSANHSGAYILLWVLTAVACVLFLGVETVKRSRRVHGGLAACMLHSAIEQFLPAIVAGGLLGVVLLRVAPQNLWMLPGLWQVVFSLGVFASCRFLPRPMFIVGIWYLVCGLICLVLAAPGEANSPWAMGIPFGVGQLLVAGILRHSYPGEARHD
jgi:hypothetical protein